MKRIFRHLFTLASAVSLLLSVAVSVLWVLSYRQPVSFQRSDTLQAGGSTLRESVLRFGMHYGRLWAYSALNGDSPGSRIKATRRIVTWRHEPWTPHPSDWRYSSGRVNGFGNWEVCGVECERGRFEWRALVPSSYLALVLAAPPIGWLYASRNRRRARAIGLCSVCHYDLRASPDRCPECGTVSQSKAGA
jgi:hypothetical protein